MLEIRSYTYAELSEMLNTTGKQGIDRKLKRYGVTFTSSGHGRNRIYKITAINDPFKIFCITELKIPAQADFDKLKNLYYCFFCIDDFDLLPLTEAEKIMAKAGFPMARQTMSKWIDCLRDREFIIAYPDDYKYFSSGKGQYGNRKIKEISRELYKQAWAIYHNKKDEVGSDWAYIEMYHYAGGHPYKKPKYIQNGIYGDKIDELINIVVDTHQIDPKAFDSIQIQKLESSS